MRCNSVNAFALLAQLVEHLTLNQGVQGSSPWRRTYDTALRKIPDAVSFLSYPIYSFKANRRPVP